jgi:glycosyltransferase involved in cell wall biosynthesis
MYAGLEKAQGDYIAILDADMQDPPSLIPSMIESLDKDEADIVAARRVTRKGEPPIRSFFARSFYKLINKMCDVEIADGARDFRLMRRQVVDAIIALNERQRFSKGIFAWVGFRTKWVEHENVERVAGETKWSFWKLFRYAIDGIVAFTTAPLRFATYCGFFFASLAFIYIVYYFIRAIILRIYDQVPGYPSLLCFMLFIGGLILMALGLLGEYIGRIFIEVKRRPQYIVSEEEKVKD